MTREHQDNNAAVEQSPKSIYSSGFLRFLEKATPFWHYSIPVNMISNILPIVAFAGVAMVSRSCCYLFWTVIDRFLQHELK